MTITAAAVDEGKRAAQRSTLFTQLEDFTDIAREGREIEAAGIPYLVDGIIPAFGMLGFLIAYAKVGKTTFGQALAAHVAQGLPFLDRATAEARVLVLAAEDPPEYTAWVARNLNVPRGRMKAFRHPLRLSTSVLDEIVYAVEQGQFGFVLVSSWQAVVAGIVQDENDNAGSVAVVEAVKTAARQTRVPWLIDAHSGKGEDQGDDADPLRAMRGASSAAGSADYVLSLRYANGTFGTRRRLSGKGRFVSLEPLTLEFDAASSSYSLIGEAGQVSRESTWRLIEELGALDQDEPRSATDIARRCGLIKPGEKPSGAKRQQIYAALKDRPDVGRVDGLRGGQKTTLFRRLILP